MVLNYTFFYVEANIVCIIIFTMLLALGWGSSDRQETRRIFNWIMVSHILYFISDICWALIMAGKLPYTSVSVTLVSISNAILMCCLTCFWFIYVELSQGEKYIANHNGRGVACLPALFETVLIVTLFIFFPSSVMDEYLNTNDVYTALLFAIPVLYILVGSIRSVSRAFRKENYAVRSQYITYAVYPLIVILFGLLQMVWLRAPLFCFGCTVMMVYVYINALNNRVSLDSLTNLNNRAQLKKYIAQESNKINLDKGTHYVLMMDLNKFKMINDRYGHIEGDNAIVRTADAIRISCLNNDMRPFIARYGGDEFIIIARTDNEDYIKELCSTIKENVVKLNTEAAVPYDLTASIGYAEYSGDVGDFQAALKKADENLYKDKAKTR